MPAISRRADRLRPALPRAVQEGLEVAVRRVFEGEAVEDGPSGAQERERVEDADGARMPVQELPEVGLAHPAVDVLAGLDADDGGTRAARGRIRRAR